MRWRLLHALCDFEPGVAGEDYCAGAAYGVVAIVLFNAIGVKMTDRESLLSECIKIALDQLARADGDIIRLPEPSQTLLAVQSAQGIIDNGGLQFFFENDFPHNPPYMVFIEAYRRIGAEDAAQALEQAVARFPFWNPHLHCELRNEFMDAHRTEGRHVFDAIDCICGEDDIYTRLVDYCLRHLSAFIRCDRNTGE
jgi:hypothetical protein